MTRGRSGGWAAGCWRGLIATGLLVACAPGEEPASPAFRWESWPDTEGDSVRPEHPRPDWRRRDWVNLNGDWQFRAEPADATSPTRPTDLVPLAAAAFDRTITVPFPWGAPRAGVAEPLTEAGGTAWYRRTVQLPDRFRAAGWRVHLIVGAADWDTVVWWNGVEVGRHANGYLPLRLDVTEALRPVSDGATPPEEELVLRVVDPGNHAEFPHGKQGPPWYANFGGIWQTVWLEAVPTTHLAELLLEPDLPGHRFLVRGRINGAPVDSTCQRTAGTGDRTAEPVLQEEVAGTAWTVELPTPWLTPWSPAWPELLELEWELACPGSPADRVRTVSGLRRVTRQQVPGAEFEAVHLNGVPVYLRGVLLQGYHPDGGYTQPSEAALLSDLEQARAAGFNLIRLHLKVEEPRLLYHADRLGLLVDADVPCYGLFPVATGDTPAARARWQETLEGMIRRDFNHPALIWWTLFNEDWGLLGGTEVFDEERQRFVRAMLERARALDPTRLVEDHSALREDHVAGTDINSFHLYADDPVRFASQLEAWTTSCRPGSPHNFVAGALQDGAPLVNTEYGPFSYEFWLGPAARDRDISWGLRTLTGVLRRSEPLVGYIFTELYDVEFENNGLLDYDRTPKALGYPAGLTAAALHGAEFVGFVEHEFRLLAGDRVLRLTPFVSRWTGAHAADAAGVGDRLRLTLLDEQEVPVGAQELELGSPPRWRVTTFPALELPLPADLTGVVHVLAEWLDPAGQPRARNVLTGEILAPAPPQQLFADGWWRVHPDLATCQGAGPLERQRVRGQVEAIGFQDAGALHCPVPLPPTLADAEVLDVRFVAELSANQPGAAQTTSRPGPTSRVRVRLDTTLLATLELPPERADSRGALSHLHGAAPRGGYGELIRTAPVPWRPTHRTPATLALATDEDPAHGLLLYGRRLGSRSVPVALELRRSEE